MKWSLQIARIDGTDIKIHWSFILLVPYIWIVLSPDTPRGWLISVSALVLVFGCILLHELGHSMVANRLGVPTKTIILWPLGGFALLSRVPERPMHQLAIYGAGPFVNLILALVGWLLRRLLFTTNFHQTLGAWSPTALSLLAGLSSGLIFINLFLAIFNLLPAYPLDGGRILHAILQLLFGLRWANRATLALSWLLAPGLLLLGWWLGDWIIIFVGLMIFIFAGTLNKNVNTAFNSGLMWLSDRSTYLLQRGDFTSALAHAERMVQAHPRDSQGYLDRANAYFHLKRPDLALADYTHALALEPNTPLAYAYRFYAYIELNQYDRALADIQHFGTLQPDSEMSVHGLAYLYSQLKDFDRALGLYKQPNRQNIDYLGSLINSGLVIIEADPYAPTSYQQATQMFERVLKLDPQSIYGLFGLGVVAMCQQERQKALSYYQQVLSMDNTNAQAHMRLGTMYLQSGQLELAEQHLEQACRVPSSDYSALLHRGRLRFVKGDQAAANDDWGTLLRWGNTAYLLFSELSLLNTMQNQLDWALAYYAFAEQLLPDRAEVHCGRADAYRINQRYAEALTAYNRALAMNAELAEAWYRRGLVNKAIGQPAYSDFQHAIQYTTNTTLQRWAHEHLADAV